MVQTFSNKWEKGSICLSVILKFPGLQNPFGFTIQSESRYMAVKEYVSGTAERANSVAPGEPKEATSAPSLFPKLRHRMAVRTKAGLPSFPTTGRAGRWTVEIKKHVRNLCRGCKSFTAKSRQDGKKWGPGSFQSGQPAPDRMRQQKRRILFCRSSLGTKIIL